MFASAPLFAAVLLTTQATAAAPQTRVMPPLPSSVFEALRTSAPIQASTLVGRWTDDGVCSSGIVMNADGTFVLPQGQTFRWRLSGDVLTFIGNSEAVVIARQIGRDRIITINADGTLGQSVRC